MHAHFAETLLSWYATHRRELPWRGIDDPYKIWVSEIILQQTRVEQGLDYYRRFIEAFPCVDDLAKADDDKVMRLWQGLGYYSRARNMHEAAKQIVAMGAFPHDYATIRQLKGVGDYTAAAICSFAHNMPCAVVDGNVYRVLSRHFGISEPVDTSHGKKLFATLASELLPKERTAEYNQALMDFGALQCTPASPKCEQCVLCDTCVARANQNVNVFPAKKHRTKVRERYFIYIGVYTPDGLWLRQRGSGDIWQGLYEPPLVEFDHAASFEELLQHPFIQKFSKEGILTLQCQQLKHILTHRIIHATAYSLNIDHSVAPPEGFKLVKAEDSVNYAVPRLVQLLFNQPLQPHRIDR